MMVMSSKIHLLSCPEARHDCERSRSKDLPYSSALSRCHSIACLDPRCQPRPANARLEKDTNHILPRPAPVDGQGQHSGRGRSAPSGVHDGEDRRRLGYEASHAEADQPKVRRILRRRESRPQLSRVKPRLFGSCPRHFTPARPSWSGVASTLRIEIGRLRSRLTSRPQPLQ